MLLGILGALAAMKLPYLFARNELPEGTVLTLREQEDGALLLSWPRARSAEGYILEITLPADGPEADPLFHFESAETECLLPEGLPEDELLEFRINTYRTYRVPREERVRWGERPVSVQCYLNRPAICDLRAEADPDRDTVTLSWRGWRGDDYHLYLQQEDGSLELLREPETVRTELRFGPDGDFPIPEREESYAFVLDAAREAPGLAFYGAASGAVTVTREDLLGRDLALRCAEEGDNAYTLTWDETKGAGYEVQLLDADSGRWSVLRTYTPEEERTYHTGRLAPCADYSLRVTAVGGQALSGGGYAAESAPVELHTAESVLYATVWPMRDLPAYTDTDRRETAGAVTAAAAYCVLEERDGMFRVRCDGGTGTEGYIDANYCMINLPEYIGGLCDYDITNSYSSLYLVHERRIPEVSDTVITGYENVLQADGSFLVPLLYPVTEKLVSAARAAAADGYRLKIYDSYRPNRATREIYDLTAAVLNQTVPEELYERRTLEMYLNGQEPAYRSEPEDITFRKLMTNGYYNLNSFLALGGSMHNLGVAMDLTLERLSDGEELAMQTRMHDLSWYSSMGLNDDNANLLDRYMKAAGFGSIGSEWWHFQDNDARAALDPPLLWPGVSAEGWKADGLGWRWRQADGSYFRDGLLKIGGTDYFFDENGYVKK